MGSGGSTAGESQTDESTTTERAIEPNAVAAKATGYELLDAGDGRRLERFGGLVLDRPAPGATSPRRAPSRWRDANLHFEAGHGWIETATALAESWVVDVEGLTLELRATSSGGVGLYPEHLLGVRWLRAEVRAAVSANGSARVLNLFAHTGLATLAAASAGAAVVHVDAARGSVAWARRNAELNGLAGHPIRWLVDDALAFTEREARRGRRYDGLIVDPPSAGYAGHAGKGRWTLRGDLARLLDACATVAVDGAFVLLTAHSTGFGGEALQAALESAFPTRVGRAAVRPLVLRAASGAALELGWAVRLGGRSDRPRSRNAAP